MSASVRILLYGSLASKAGSRQGQTLLELEKAIPLRQALRAGDVPPGQVQLVMINHKPVSLDTLVQPGDRVSVFPREYPIFADWKDFRMK